MTDEPKQEAPLQSEEKEEKVEDPSDRLTPNHPRFKEVVAEKNQLKEEVAAMRDQLITVQEQISSRQEETGDYLLTDEEKRALDLIDREFKRRGFVTKDELEDVRKVQTRAQQFSDLSKKYDGTTGYPKFESPDVLEYAKQHGYGEDYENAYYGLHREAIIDVEAKRRAGIEVPTSEKPIGGEKITTKTEYTPEDIRKMSEEEFEQLKASLKASVRGK